MATIGIDTRLSYYRQGGIAEYMRQLVNALAALPSEHHYKILHNYRSAEDISPHLQRVNCYTPCHFRYEGVALGLELLPQGLALLHSPDFIPPRWGAKHYIITVHDLAFLLFADIQTADSLRYYAGQIRRAVRQAAQIIAVSQATKDDLIRLLDVPPEKISVVWEGLHPQFCPTEKALSDLPPDYILFVGTLEPRKNLPVLLEAYALLKARQRDIPKLVLAGAKGWMWEGIFQKISDLKLEADVLWLGQVPFADLPALYSGASLHILVSLYEGFGFPMLEAMACGTPTLVSNRGSLPEIGGQAAIYVDPDSPEAIAHEIESLLAAPTRAADLRAKGLAHIQAFTWAKTAQQTLKIYEQVLDKA